MSSAEELISLTIGGFQNTHNLKRNRLFAEYIKQALPPKQVSDVKVISTPASLNSAAGSGIIDGKKYFFKVHIESGSKFDEEYKQAGLLAGAGWPVYAPSMQSKNPDFPLLVYPWTDNPTLFGKLERSYKSGESKLTDKDFKLLEIMNKTIGKAQLKSLKKISGRQAAGAPIQMFFARRFETDGRIDEWYDPKTIFSLPGENGETLALSWPQIKRAKWAINGQVYPKTLDEIIKEAKDVLVFSGEDTAWTVISHGDDHAGNIFLGEDQAQVFDPAAASNINPAVLSDAKALAHSGFLPMGGMYYDPKTPYEYGFDEKKNILKVNADFSKSPAFDAHSDIAGQIIDFRINPILRALKEKGADMNREYKRLKTALAGCALLTVNISKLLEMNDGRGAGLLPMAILLYELEEFEILKRVGAT